MGAAGSGDPAPVVGALGHLEIDSGSLLRLGEHVRGALVEGLAVDGGPTAEVDRIGHGESAGLTERGEGAAAGQAVRALTGGPQLLLPVGVRLDGVGAEVTVDPRGVEQPFVGERLLDDLDGFGRAGRRSGIALRGIELRCEHDLLHVDRLRCLGRGRVQGEAGGAEDRGGEGRGDDGGECGGPHVTHLLEGSG